MKRTLLVILGLVGLIGVAAIFLFITQKSALISPLSSLSRKVDYSPYSFENLRQREYYRSEVKLEKILQEQDAFTSYLFSYSADGRKVTGMANLPKEGVKLPVAILIRGWVDEKVYKTGMGSEKMAAFLAENGFLTLAPDFLGFGDSDPAFPDMLQDRFFKPIVILTLLESLDSLPQADPERVVIWGHSNGGQVALSVLEITGEKIPTSLWAPVSAPFPQAVLQYADELEDEGKLVRKVISEFENKYDTAKYSITTYFDQIEAPLIIHQGMADEAIPLEWTEELVGRLRSLGKEVTYFQYPGENHNFHYGSAPVARERDLEFFKEKLKSRLDKGS